MAGKNSFFESEEVKAFNEDIQQYNLGPLWNAIPDLMNKTPDTGAEPYLWKWETIYQKLMEAKEIFTPERGGERRAIYLQNPGLTDRKPWGWGSTTQNLYAAVQLILPGEKAPSHRHTQSALRFITNGDGAFSTVDGEKMYMNEGDFLVTPGGLWHGHGHEGDEPMIWMDCLDIPFVYSIGGTFFEPYPDGLQPAKKPDNYSSHHYEGGMVRPITHREPQVAPVGKYTWAQTKDALDSISQYEPDPYDGYGVEYINPSTGEQANPTILAKLLKLPSGFKGKAHRHTDSNIFTVYKGSGYTVINGQKFEWSKGDYFVIPSWATHEHVVTSSEDAYLFNVSDQPIMEKFNFQQEEAYEENEGHQQITSVFEPK
ncbi:cupin domain-containing protein [Pontibacillus marinus]|uniref:Cupin n=1 Tax=Pontibacillus marinus BH030004 = DSM 16465 TaxID=1385511 RepID=A0A0A5HSN2_9BACI|nr:cupin domain-containing protein [Pontibacillus marinus]KGX86652.1 cupin [Pontibacillus marinus BH030004 = DSM 16465]